MFLRSLLSCHKSQHLYFFIIARSLKNNKNNKFISKAFVSLGVENRVIIPKRGIVNTTVVYSNMLPKRIISYEDMLKLIHQPEKLIIDVRNPDEINSTGQIPSSINIPLSNVESVLSTMSEDEFKKQFQRPKPSASDELIFYCQSGRRSSEAVDKALSLGYSESKTYLGSWNEWSSKQS